MASTKRRPRDQDEDAGDEAPLSDGQEFLRDLKRAADPDDYVKLLVAGGGRRVFIAKHTIQERSWMSLAIGFERAQEVLDRLKEFSHFPGSEVDMPMDRGGILAAVYQRTHEMIVAGVTVGKSPTQIAAECGMTRRAVQIHIKKMRDAGMLPEVDPLHTVAAPYLSGGNSFSAALRRTPDRQDAKDGGYLTVEELDALREVADAFASSYSTPSEVRVTRICALIERLHGPEVLARIREACAGEAVGFQPFDIAQADHPLRRVLPDRAAAIVAIGVKAAGLDGKCVLAPALTGGMEV